LAAAIAQAQSVLQLFHYDASGNALGFAPAAALTALLYRGEQFDSLLGLQYLRARLYNPATGRFTTLDPSSGPLPVPLSLNKYLYAHGDPVNGKDPSGKDLSSMLASISIGLGRLAMGCVALGKAFFATAGVMFALSAVYYVFAGIAYGLGFKDV